MTAPGRPAPVSPDLECTACAPGVTPPHGVPATQGQAVMPPKWTGKFRKLPVVIEAVQLTDDNAAELAAWSGGREASIWQPTMPPVLKARLVIPTLEGDHLAVPGDWVIKGVKGEFYPCRPDIFEATYEPAAQEPHAADGDGFTVHDLVRYPDEPQPAPELAAAVLAEVLDFLGGGIPPGDEFALQVARWRKRGLPS